MRLKSMTGTLDVLFIAEAPAAARGSRRRVSHPDGSGERRGP